MKSGKIEVLYKNPKSKAKPAAKSTTKSTTKEKTQMAGKVSQAYCLRCKENVTIKNGKKVNMNNPKREVFAIKGTCPHCGTGVFRILPSS